MRIDSQSMAGGKDHEWKFDLFRVIVVKIGHCVSKLPKSSSQEFESTRFVLFLLLQNPDEWVNFIHKELYDGTHVTHLPSSLNFRTVAQGLEAFPAGSKCMSNYKHRAFLNLVHIVYRGLMRTFGIRLIRRIKFQRANIHIIHLRPLLANRLS